MMNPCRASVKLHRLIKEETPVISSDIEHDSSAGCDGSCRHIVGYLTPWPKHVPKERWLGDLFLESENAAVICEPANLSERHIELPVSVRCTRWNFVVAESKSQSLLEIHEWEVVDPLQSLCQNEYAVVNVSTGSVLLQNKDRLKCKIVNITGEVVQLSEIIRIKGEPLFLVQLSSEDHKINILVKKPKYLFWQKLLEPQKQYIITGLRPTTLYKGSEQETKLYVPWDKCHVFESNSDVLFNALNLKEWLCLHNEVDIICNEAELETPSSESNSGTRSMFSYKGIITSADDSEKGIYELDNRIRLYLTYVPAVHKFRHLRLGTEIVVYNAHHTGSPKSFLHHDLEMVHLINQYSIPLQKLDDVLKLVTSINHRFKLDSARTADSSRLIFKALTIPSASSGSSLLTGNVRDMLHEFFDPGHKDCCVMPKEDTFSAICSFPSIAEIKRHSEDYARSYSETRERLSSAPLTRKELNHQAYWTKFDLGKEDLDKKWVVIGKLDADEVKGQVTLTDQTGSLDSVISATLDNEGSHGFLSSGPEAEDRSIPCDLTSIQPQHLGRLIRVDNYRLVVERFTLSNFPEAQDIGNAAYIEKVHFKTSIQFSMKNVTFLSKYSDLCSATYLIPKKGSLIKKTLEPKDARDNTRERNYNTDHENIAGEKLTESSNRVNIYKAQLLVLTHKDSLHVQSRVSNRPKLRFYATASFINEPRVIEKQMSAGESGETPSDIGDSSSAKLPVRHVALSFQNSSVRWYHILKPHYVYRLVYKDDSGTGILSWAHQSLQRAVEKTNTRNYVSIATDAWFIGIIPDGKGSNSALEKLTTGESKLIEEVMGHLSSTGHIRRPLVVIEDALNHSIQEPVSFRGKILSRHFTENCQGEPMSKTSGEEDNERLGVSVPCNLHLCLTLGDPDLPFSDARLKLYIQPRNMSYPLGLLDGATVEVHKAQLKRSQRDSVYGQFLVSSSISVVKQAGNSASAESRSDKAGLDVGDLTSYPFIKLYDLWRQSDPGSRVLRSVCQLHKIMSVSLWSDCTTCGNPHKLGSCTYMPCGSKSEPKIKAKASAIVDDGTANAYLTCTGNALVRILLDLNATQWEALEHGVKEQGELHVNKNSGTQAHPQGGGLEVFLAALSDSCLVKRPLQICARYTPNKTNFQGWSWRQVEVGGDRLETKSLTFLQLQALHLEEVKTQQYLVRMFAENER